MLSRMLVLVYSCTGLYCRALSLRPERPKFARARPPSFVRWPRRAEALKRRYIQQRKLVGQYGHVQERMSGGLRL